MIETSTPTDQPLTKAERQAILAHNARPIIILERLWHAERRGSVSISLKAIAGFGTTQARASATLHDLQDAGHVIRIGDTNSWLLTKTGRTYLSRLWQEQIEEERRARAAAFEGWMQGELFPAEESK